MIFSHTVRVPVSRERAWPFLMDLPAVAGCVPGVTSVEQAESGYRGVMSVKVGPVGLNFAGQVQVVEADQANWVATLRAEAADKKVGGAVRATLKLQLEEQEPNATDLHLHADAALLGKVGEFGQALIKKKADTILAGFAKCLGEKLSAAT